MNKDMPNPISGPDERAADSHTAGLLLAIHHVMLNIGAELRLPVLLSNILEQAQSLLKADRGGGIYFYEPESQGLRLVHGSGINQGRSGIVVQVGQGVAGRVYRTAQPLVIDDYTAWQEKATVLVDDPPSAVLGVPLIIKEAVIGVLLLIANSRQRKFTSQDVQQAEMFAAQAAVAIQNGQLYAQAQATIAEREQALAERKLAEAALHASQVTLKAIIDSTSDLIWSVEAQSFGLLTFNTGLCDYFAQQRGIALQPGLRPEDLFPSQEFIQTWRHFYQRALAEGSYTIQYETYSGNILLELNFNLLTQEGRVFGVSVFGKDITERMRARRELEELNRDLERRVEERTTELRRRLAEIEELQAELRDQSQRDPLTGLYNRRYLTQRLPVEVDRARVGGHCLSIIVSDIDHFKRINDTHGHQVGDQVLIAVARMLQQYTRDSDIICRYGGEEFLVVMPGVELETASRRAEFLRQKCAGLNIRQAEKSLQTCMSFGVATYPIHGQEAEAIIIKADQALYYSKNTGRNRVTVWDQTLPGFRPVRDDNHDSFTI